MPFLTIIKGQENGWDQGCWSLLRRPQEEIDPSRTFDIYIYISFSYLWFYKKSWEVDGKWTHGLSVGEKVRHRHEK